MDHCLSLVSYFAVWLQRCHSVVSIVSTSVCISIVFVKSACLVIITLEN